MPQKVSIIIAAYNAGKFLKQAIDSIINQTWPDIELIIVNDGSTDDTLEIITGYTGKDTILINQPNSGQDTALNNGYRAATGDYIKFMDADDIINPEMIERQMQTLHGSEEYIAYSEWGRFYSNDHTKADFAYLEYWKDMGPVDFLTARPAGVMLQCGTMLAPKKIIEKSGLWDERLSIFNDTEFFTRVLLASNGVKFSPGAKLYYRSGQPGSITSQRTRKSFESSLLAFSLIGEQMTQYENSKRVRNLVANMFTHRYHEMYPDFPDLRNPYIQKAREYGGASVLPKGSMIYNMSVALIGWKATKHLQRVIAKARSMVRTFRRNELDASR